MKVLLTEKDEQDVVQLYLSNSTYKEINNEYHIGIKRIKSILDKYNIQIRDSSASSKIGREKAKQTCLERYGVDNPNKSEEIKERSKQTSLRRYGTENPGASKKARAKCKQTCLERYGVDNISKLDSVRKKVKQTSLARFGTENPYQSAKIKEKIRLTNLERYGVEHASQNNQIKEKVKQTCLNKYGVEYPMQMESAKEKSKQTCLKKYGVEYTAQIPHIAAKKSKKYITEEGVHLDSSWELNIYNFFKRIGKEVERNIPIEYEYNNKKHVTFIDFRVDGYLLECKASHLLSGCFDYAEGMIPIDTKLDVYKKNHVIIITDKSDIFGKPNSLQSNGLKYQNKCPNPLIGIDISLFNNPAFPFAKDKPKCFYNVRVDGKPSSLEAWSDESLRWEMIKNRIEYSGGFIDNKQILNAMNITRTCKQPSWFSKSLAKKIIQEYATTDVIVDPFAGWGARHDATIELNKQYIGSDYNKELVEWHKSLGRNIEYKDANEFHYDGLCSVFICPPYSDPKTGRCFEDYNFEHFDESAKAMSQCDWLKLCMKNIPNAAEYIMICKVVDEGFEKYIIDTKNNKSHFGLNKEYIIVIKNS